MKNSKIQFIALLTFLLLFQVSSFSQKIQTDDNEFTIEILSSRKLKKIQISTLKILKSEQLKTVFIKIDMATLDNTKKDFDINKFILLDTVNKLKIRALDISYQNFSAYTNFYNIAKKSNTSTSNDSNLTFASATPDSFENYNFQGYQTLEIPINYGTNKKPDFKIIYYKPQQFNSKKIVFFFPFPKYEKEGVLYYGNQKIAVLNFD